MSETIRWATADTQLGPMLVAASGRGICRLSFEEDESDLHRHFPGATIEPAGDEMKELAARAAAAVDAPGEPHDLPLDLRGTAFQQAVWRELARIPPGESLSYAALAERAGKPGAARAAGSACGANKIAVLIPCHRARRGDGSPGGFAYGLERKAALLEREGWKERVQSPSRRGPGSRDRSRQACSDQASSEMPACAGMTFSPLFPRANGRPCFPRPLALP